MKKIFVRRFFFLLFSGILTSLTVSLYAQTAYKLVSKNLITNSTFDFDANFSTTIKNWTINPAGDMYWGVETG